MIGISALNDLAAILCRVTGSMSVKDRPKEDWVLTNISLLMKAIFVVAVLAVTNGHTNELDLKLLIEEALARNPSLSALKHRWSAFEARIPQAGALNDPRVRFDLMNLHLNHLFQLCSQS